MEYKRRQLTVLLQNENGPCPLLAVANALALKGAIVIPQPSSSQPTIPFVTVEDLVKEFICTQPRGAAVPRDENHQFTVDAAVRLLPRLARGLDVNPKFEAIDHFEPTDELAVFDAARLRLVHGMTLDPQETALLSEIGQHSYNVMTVRSTDPSSVPRFIEWQEQFPTQLTFRGLIDLTQNIREDEIAVLFRNNHFSVLTKSQGVLYTLVTDVGVVQAQPSTPWESLVDLTGESSVFRDAYFGQGPPPPPAAGCGSSGGIVVDAVPFTQSAAAPVADEPDDDEPPPPRKNSQLVRRETIGGDRSVVMLNKEQNDGGDVSRRRDGGQQAISTEFSQPDGMGSGVGGEKKSDDRCCCVM